MTLFDFFKYFESTYIGELKRGMGVSRKEPKYPHAIWSLYERNCDDLPRNGIKLEQSNTELLQTQIKTGRIPKRKAAYIFLDNRIKELIISYSRNNAMDIFSVQFIGVKFISCLININV
ncbi:hypothetical protein BpHYR1_036930 [Brachionus plicatilis]|uniref:Uncharacterized protein n=1 Tax=Brachionus plicatilis TaxID=10195 RepID=A0A3M7PIJ4_BRAPC|nr:hypothetical protein BpHYR1_036930 [Brachionus plicatilis]